MFSLGIVTFIVSFGGLALVTLLATITVCFVLASR